MKSSTTTNPWPACKGAPTSTGAERPCVNGAGTPVAKHSQTNQWGKKGTPRLWCEDCSQIRSVGARAWREANGRTVPDLLAKAQRLDVPTISDEDWEREARAQSDKAAVAFCETINDKMRAAASSVYSCSDLADPRELAEMMPVWFVRACSHVWGDA
jgi:hypothetical protein